MANHLMLVESRNTLVVVFGIKKATDAFKLVRARYGEEPWSLGKYGCTKESIAALRADVQFEVEEHNRTVLSIDWEGNTWIGLYTGN